MATDRVPPAVSMEDLWFSYGSVPLLREVNVEIAPREWVAVVGPNGGGKTTLLKLILGLLRPRQGRLRVLGREAGEARRWVGYTPQGLSFDPSFPVTVADVVLMGRLGRGIRLGPYRRSDRIAAGRALEEVGLAGAEGRSFAELSGGQRQRVLIARALVGEPELLLLDEPTAGLDQEGEAALYELLAGLTERMAIVMVSHDLAFVSDRVQRVVCVRGTVAVHPTAELSGDLVRDLYGLDVRLVRHDHDCLRECMGDGSHG